MTKSISDHVKIWSLFITDRYYHYSKPDKNAMFTHEVVLHNLGFVYKKGFHTNYIENSELNWNMKEKRTKELKVIYQSLIEWIYI